ncbi:MAG: DNA translocase FtsK 4TM domain-containing protein [Fimbriimonadaceae bacterium]|nr:DNA translocase FtsK 4TM domain-containing protein [Fimbriimonadaceae bacterium]
MPKEGPTPTRKTPARSRKAPEQKIHQLPDIGGILLLVIACALLIGLAARNGGIIGDSLAKGFSLLFGRGAWLAPIGLGAVGIAMILKHRQKHSGRLITGAVFIFLGILGALAKPIDGDFFTDQAMQTSGGYFGAIIGWALTSLMGGGKVIAVIAIVLIGVVLALDDPLKEVLKRFTAPREPVENKKTKAVPETTNEKEDRRAKTMRMLEESEREKSAEAPIKKQPLVHESNRKPSEIQLDITSEAPKDGYILPPLNLLAEPSKKNKRDPKEVQRNIEILEDTLEQFGVEANVTEVANGPTITRYEVALGTGIRVSKIKNLADNIAMSLAAQSVRVEAPIPGKSAIGFEIPTAQRQMVSLREMCDSLEFHDQQNKLTIALGHDVAGQSKYTDLTRMPHLLVGGATNSGKSICLASIIMSLILRLTPKDLRLVMIDPKRVELTLFENLPHLMCPVVKDVKEAAGVLRAVVREMDRRYDQFSEAGVRNIDGWNAKASFQDRLPFIVVIVDELADLMIQCRNEVETSICRLAQLARATGIHLIIATQRPSVDVITGTIKNNISSRIAFAVSSGIDSRTILDSVGAEDLIGKGDMLFLPIDATKPIRVQGCYVSEKEIEDVCNFWRQQEKPRYVINPVEVAIKDKEDQMRESGSADEHWEEAVRFVAEKGQASTSMLQRRFSIGFQRASRLLDLMEERGIVGAREGSRPREVMIDVMGAEAMLGNASYDSPMPDGAYLDDD